MPETFGGVDATHKLLYQNNVQFATQKYESYYMRACTPLSIKGETEQVLELIGPSEVIFDQPDDAPSPHIPPKHNGIYVQPRKLNWGRLVSNSTDILSATNYNSSYVHECAKAFERGKDDVFLPALTGDRKIRSSSTKTPVNVAFDLANQQVPVNFDAAGNTPLTVEKLLRVLELFAQNDVDVMREEVWATMRPADNRLLYKEIEFTSKDYRDTAVFDKKTVRQFLGINFIVDPRIPLAPSTSYRRALFWCKSYMHFGTAKPLQTVMDRVIEKQNQVQIYAEGWYAATRSEDVGVVEVLCTG